MVQGGMSCIKYLMFVFNFVFVVCGIGLIIVGAVVQNKDFTVFLNSKYVTAPTILIVVGVIIFVLAFLGCFGSVKENHCMVMAFGILLFIVFVIEIAGGIAAYVNKSELEGVLKENMNTTIYQNKKDFNKIWDEMQTKWKCCGINNAQDYIANNRTVPPSCCPQAQAQECSAESAFTKGCYDQLLEKVKSAIGVVGGVAIGIGVVELIGVMFSCCLASAIKREYEGV